MRRCASFHRSALWAGGGLSVLWLLFFTGASFGATPAGGDARAPHAGAAAAAPTATAAAATAAAADEGDAIDTDSPRRALERFLQNARDGQFAQAADDLWPVSSDAEEMTSLARKLQAVLDRRLPFDAERLAKVSDSPTGNLDDGLPEQDELGRIQMPLTSESVRMVRKRLANGGTHWVFSPKTLERTPAWFQRLPDHWLLDHMPHFLLVTGPGGLLYWQWLMLPIFFILSGLFGLFFSTVMRLVAWILFGRRELFKAVLERQTAPLRVLGAALALRLLLLSLFMQRRADHRHHLHHLASHRRPRRAGAAVGMAHGPSGPGRHGAAPASLDRGRAVGRRGAVEHPGHGLLGDRGAGQLRSRRSGRGARGQKRARTPHRWHDAQLGSADARR
jgi:hypothetical protein